ncbi:hypothetical protein AMI01nite_20570 [Aneurinibacillus migulanus]|nr:hypothetical protein AMI01nite_20570 [Aneurinibacillus migulanus]
MKKDERLSFRGTTFIGDAQIVYMPAYLVDNRGRDPGQVIPGTPGWVPANHAANLAAR